MQQTKVFEYLKKNNKNLFPNKHYTYVEVANALINTPDTFEYTMNRVKLKDPAVTLVLSIFLGFFGIDRFYVGNIFMGLLKLCTYGGFYILWILDAIRSFRICRNRNCKKLMNEIQKALALKGNYTPTVVQPQTPTIAPVNDPPRPTVVQSPVNVTPPVQTVTPARVAQLACDESKPFVFMSYAHKDNDKVLPMFAAFQKAGMNIWYDEGIRAGYEWEREIIDNLAKASGFLFFVSENSLMSQNCRDELYQARKRNKKFINILIEDVDFTKPEHEWFDFRYSRYQQIPAYAMTSDEVIEKIRAGLEE